MRELLQEQTWRELLQEQRCDTVGLDVQATKITTMYTGIAVWRAKNVIVFETKVTRLTVALHGYLKPGQGVQDWCSVLEFPKISMIYVRYLFKRDPTMSIFFIVLETEVPQLMSRYMVISSLARASEMAPVYQTFSE